MLLFITAEFVEEKFKSHVFPTQNKSAKNLPKSVLDSWMGPNAQFAGQLVIREFVINSSQW